MSDVVVDGPELAGAVLDVLADPPCDGMLIVRPMAATTAAGFAAGDVIASLNGTPTPDLPSFETAYRTRVSGPVPYDVVRDSEPLRIDADRFVVAHAGPIAVRRGEPIAPRPPETARLDPRRLAEPVEILGERVSNAFGLRAGSRTKKGFERHRLLATAGVIELRSDVSFAEFADTFAFTALSTLTIDKGLRLSSLSWRDPVRFAEVTGAVMARQVVLEATGPSGRARLSHPVSAELVPSLLVPLAACFLPRAVGAAAHVSPLPEDAYPWWSVGGSHAFFPLDPQRLPKTIVCAGEEDVRVGRTVRRAWRFDAIALGRTWATTWVDGDGGVVAIDRGANGLLPADPAIVRAGLISLRA